MSNDLITKRQSIGLTMQAYQAAVDDFDHETARILGVNITDLRCLEILVNAPDQEITPRMIAHQLGITTGSVTTMLDRLEAVSYITRARHSTDRRKVLIHATPTVRERTWTMFGPLLEESAADVIAQFTTEELDIVERFIKRATEVQRRHVDRLRGIR